MVPYILSNRLDNGATSNDTSNKRHGQRGNKLWRIIHSIKIIHMKNQVFINGVLTNKEWTVNPNA